MNKKLETRWVKYNDIDLVLEGKYYAGYPGTWEQPEEPEDFDIYGVFIGETEITNILSDEQIGELKELALER